MISIHDLTYREESLQGYVIEKITRQWQFVKYYQVTSQLHPLLIVYCSQLTPNTYNLFRD